jgi:hypothetical protein
MKSGALRIMLRSFILLSFTGCAFIENNIFSPAILPTPEANVREVVFSGMEGRKITLKLPTSSDFVSSIVVYQSRMTFDEEMCVNINERYLWNPGDNAQSLYSHFAAEDNFQFTIDNIQKNFQNGQVYYESSLVEYQIETDQGIISFGSSNYCLNTAMLSPGVHMVTMQLLDTSGQSYSYSWEFEISHN